MPIGFIFLDMDETLGFFRNYDGSMNSEGFPNGIFLRRYIKEILEKLNKDFILFLTTAATLNYTKSVLEYADLRKYFHRIFTRNDFVKLENPDTDANKEASPGGYEKHYGRIMRHFGISMEDAIHGLIIGDNDYDISCDVLQLRTFIVDSLFVPADILYTIIRDIFDRKDLTYDKLGIKITKKTQKHPIADIETEIFEIECPDNLLAIELEKVDVLLTEEAKQEMKVQPEEIKAAEDLAKGDNLEQAYKVLTSAENGSDELLKESLKSTEDKNQSTSEHYSNEED